MSSIKSQCRVNDIVSKQIGRRARDILGVARVCHFGLPQVELVHPFLGGAPHPSILWLSCPALDRSVARLESGGMIHELNQLLQADEELMGDQVNATRIFVAYRQALAEAAIAEASLTGEGEAGIRSDRTKIESFSSGIDGSGDHSRVKCLHSHIAAQLAFRSYRVGEMIQERIAANYCEEPCA